MVEGLARRLYFPFWDAEGLDEMAVLAFWLANCFAWVDELHAFA